MANLVSINEVLKRLRAKNGLINSDHLTDAEKQEFYALKQLEHIKKIEGHLTFYTAIIIVSITVTIIVFIVNSTSLY